MPMSFIDSDARAAAKLANDGLLELYEKYGRIEAENVELTRRIEELEDGQRPSRVDADFEARVISAIEKRTGSSYPPDSTVEVTTPGGAKVRSKSPWWLVLALAILAFCALIVTRAKELSDAIRR